jgi:hypothetical protein
MTLHTLKETNGIFLPEDVVEGFASMIWTERFSAFGDFEVLTPSTAANRALLAEDTWLGYSESDRIMRVRNIEDYVDDEGRSMLKVTGPSIEKPALSERPVRRPPADGAPLSGDWEITGYPGDVARTVFDTICRNNTLYPVDNIPGLVPGNFYPADTIPETDEDITVAIKVGNVYDTIKSIVDPFELGFRLIKHPTTGALYFNVYSGNNRTSSQSAVEPVVFSPELDNLSNPTQFSSNEDYRNVAYVFSSFGSAIVQIGDVTEAIVGFDRRIMYVEVTEEPEFTGTAIEIATQAQAYLVQKGREALVAQRKLLAFDGEISQNGKYKYNRDYLLGDLVQLQNKDKITKFMRVTEQIFVEDAEGKRSYPTLSDVLLITPGTWMSWDYGMEWAIAPDTLFWQNASG